MTPELIKKAEYVKLVQEGPAAELADMILANRSDFDAEGNPIPVDEAFAKQHGFEWRELDCNGPVLTRLMHDNEDESPDHRTLLAWNDDGSWGLWGEPRYEDVGWETMPLLHGSLCKHRHELRQLLQVLGGQQ